MEELIKIEKRVLNGENVLTVDAWELYRFLGAKESFQDWFNAGVERNNFKKKIDFLIVPPSKEAKARLCGLKVTLASDYYVTLEMARRLSVIELTPRSKEARQYFIQCEEQLPKPATSLELISELSSEIIKLQKRLEEESKARDERLDKIEAKLELALSALDLYNRITASPMLYTSAQMGSLFNMSARSFNEKLKEHHITSHLSEKGVVITHTGFGPQHEHPSLGARSFWGKRDDSVKSQLKFKLSIVPLLEIKFGIKANEDILKQFLYEQLKDYGDN